MCRRWRGPILYRGHWLLASADTPINPNDLLCQLASATGMVSAVPSFVPPSILCDGIGRTRRQGPNVVGHNGSLSLLLGVSHTPSQCLWPYECGSNSPSQLGCTSRTFVRNNFSLDAFARQYFRILCPLSLNNQYVSRSVTLELSALYGSHLRLSRHCITSDGGSGVISTLRKALNKYCMKCMFTPVSVLHS